MNDQGLSRRALLVIAATGLVTALVALLVTHLVVGSEQPTYRATAQVALVPAPTVPAEQVPSYWESLGGGQAATIGAEVLKQSQWLAPAAQAANVTPDQVTVTAAATASTSLITVTATTTSPQGAEAAATALIQAATPTVQQVSGPYTLQVAQPATGTAVPASIPESQLLMVVFAGALFVGAGVALVVARGRARRQAPEERQAAQPVAAQPVAADPVRRMPPAPVNAGNSTSTPPNGPGSGGPLGKGPNGPGSGPGNGRAGAPAGKPGGPNGGGPNGGGPKGGGGKGPSGGPGRPPGSYTPRGAAPDPARPSSS